MGSKFVRVNISIPAAMKARMEALDGVNWSAAAAVAFAERLAVRADAEREDLIPRLVRHRESGLPMTLTSDDVAEIYALFKWSIMVRNGWVNPRAKSQAAS